MNKEKKRKYGQKWHEAHKEERAEAKRQYRTDHLEEERERGRNKYAAHREEYLETKRKYSADHPKELAAGHQKWQETHPDKVAAQQIRRRARKANTVSALSADDIKAMKRSGCLFADSTCCGSLVVAHDIPVSRGGNTTRGNTFALCNHHNTKMHTKSLAEILVQKLLDICR